MLHPHLQTLARYNRWANRRLYAAAAELPEADYLADRGAFFGSVHRTLTHLLVADRIWLKRITGEGSAEQRLDAVPYPDLQSLRAARIQEDERIIELVDGLDEARLAGTFTYRNMAGTPFEQPLGPVLLHVFNHHTHHRGQVHALLTGLGRPSVVLDLIYYLRDPS